MIEISLFCKERKIKKNNNKNPKNMDIKLKIYSIVFINNLKRVEN